MTELTSATPIGTDLADDCLMGIRQGSVAGLRSVTPAALRKAGGVALIQRTALGSAAASISFASIPATYEDLLLVISGRSSGSGNIMAQFNADTGANYDYRAANQFGSSGGVAQTSVNVGTLGGSGDPATYPGQIDCEIDAYARTTFYKSVKARNAMVTTSVTLGNLLDQTVSGFWRSTVAISALLIFPASGNFVAGTVASLYGRQ